eukprot:gene20501-27292_t
MQVGGTSQLIQMAYRISYAELAVQSHYEFGVYIVRYAEFAIRVASVRSGVQSQPMQSGRYRVHIQGAVQSQLCRFGVRSAIQIGGTESANAELVVQESRYPLAVRVSYAELGGRVRVGGAELLCKLAVQSHYQKFAYKKSARQSWRYKSAMAELAGYMSLS